MAQTAKALGVPAKDILLENRSRDTKEQARIIRTMVGKNGLLLVTSASHMPRAMALFEFQGMKPLAAPTRHLVRAKDDALSPADFFPSLDALYKSNRAIYEYLGILWARLRGLV